MTVVLGAGGLDCIGIDRQVTHALVQPLAAREQQRHDDAEEREQEEQERDLRVAGEPGAAHDVRETLHGVVLATCFALMSWPSRCRYATSAMTCLSWSPFGPPSPSMDRASESA